MPLLYIIPSFFRIVLAGLFRQWICYGETFGEPSLQLKAISRRDLCRGALTCCLMFCNRFCNGFCNMVCRVLTSWKAVESLPRSSVNMMLAACGVDSEREVKVRESSWKATSMSESKTFEDAEFAEGCLKGLKFCLKKPKGCGQTLLPLRRHTHTQFNLTNNPGPFNACRFMVIDADVCRCQTKMYAVWWKDYGLRMSSQLDH